MRKHTLEATDGKTYAQMDRFLDKNGKPTSDEKLAAINPASRQPVENGLRAMWVNETALTTALNTAYFAERVATFAIVMGFALLLSGIGFTVISLLGAEPRHRPQAGARRPGCDPGARGLSDPRQHSLNRRPGLPSRGVGRSGTEPHGSGSPLDRGTGCSNPTSMTSKPLCCSLSA